MFVSFGVVVVVVVVVVGVRGVVRSNASPLCVCAHETICLRYESINLNKY